MVKQRVVLCMCVHFAVPAGRHLCTIYYVKELAMFSIPMHTVSVVIVLSKTTVVI